MSALASQITAVSIVYSNVCSGEDQRKHQSPSPLAFVMGIHRWPVDSPHNGPVTRKLSPFDDVIMIKRYRSEKMNASITMKFSCWRHPELSRWTFVHWLYLAVHYNLCDAITTVKLLCWLPMAWRPFGEYLTYHQTSNISRTKSKKINASRLVLQSSLSNPLKPGVKSRMTGDAPTTHVWSTIVLPTKVLLY